MLSNDTQIYHDTKELLSQVIQISDAMCKMHRYTVGRRAINVTMDMLFCLRRANSKSGKERLAWIDEFADHFDFLLTIMDAGIDKSVRSVNTKRIAVYIDLTERISKQHAGWRRATLSQTKRDCQV